jgi:spore germination cell wall hydrolase CwlJ-like protein
MQVPTSMSLVLVILFSMIRTVSAESDDSIHCLAMNIYHEARSESLAGQYAVADVVLNRVESNRYPDTICEVVKQSKLSEWWLENHNKEVPVRNKCQFSWYCDGRSDEPTEIDAWHRAQNVAISIIYGKVFRGLTEDATHYHTDYVNPKWNRNMFLVGRIGDHIFYVERS